MILDWRPRVPWASVEDCRCDAFFVWTVLLDGRLANATTLELARLHTRILELRTIHREAWLYTADGTSQGPLVVHTVRPE
jgi:hypothetical protein